jgi:hypothetical protein
MRKSGDEYAMRVTYDAKVPLPHYLLTAASAL